MFILFCQRLMMLFCFVATLYIGFCYWLWSLVHVVTIAICYSTWWKTWFFQSVFKRGELGYTFINLLSISWVLHWLGKARTDKTNRSVKTPAMLWCQVSGYVNTWGGYIRGANSRQSYYVIIRPQLGAQNYTNVINHNAYDIDQASSTYDMFIQ